MGKVMTADAHRFMVDCLKAAGAASKPAKQQAEQMLQADKMGHPCQGLSKLEIYVNDIMSKACMPNNVPKILKESKATAWVDANNVLGATAAHFCIDLAMQKACNAGVGWISVKGANHFGMGGFWAKKAADNGMLGIVLTNSPPMLAPTRSRKAALGTNPLAVVALGSKNEIFYLDISSTTVAFGKIEMYRRNREPLHPGWAFGPDGKETLNAEVAYQTGCLIPLGGSELTSGYKGFGLAGMVEVFCGILSGSRYGHHIRGCKDNKANEKADLGQCFVAVNVENFAPGFQDRLTDCLQHWRKLKPSDTCRPVLCPGDKEMQTLCETEKSGTVSYDKSQITTSAKLAENLKVKPMEVTVC